MDIAHPSLRRQFFKGNRFMEAGASSTTGERTDGWDASMAGETSPMRPIGEVRCAQAGTGHPLVCANVTQSPPEAWTSVKGVSGHSPGLP